MPPTSRGRASHSRHQSARSGKGRAAHNLQRGQRAKYNTAKPITYRINTKGKSGMGLLPIATNVSKSSVIRLRYNNTYLLKGNTEEQYRFRIQMNNPDGNDNPDLISEITGAPTVFTNTAANLSPQMTELFDQYDHAVVTQSVLKCNIRPYGNNAKTGITYETEDDPVSGNWRLQSHEPTVHGDLMAWAVLSDRNNAFVSSVIPTATLRNDTPGVKQKSLMCYNNQRKGVKFQQKYNPKTSFGLKDIGDNQTRIGFTPSKGPNEKIFSDIGIQPIIPHTMAGDGPDQMPDLYVSFQIDYVIKFTERRPQANVARPYSGEHTEL